jgi:hypothetical protein
MSRQLVLFKKTNNTNIKVKEFLLLLSAFAIIYYNIL